ncbi:MAG TPA: hypothetical protein PK733_02060 [Clostridiales bacterium]|nr:hypothetical protein [Clostridiales bacterium]
MKNRNVQKLEAITPSTLIVGIDIAKEIQWARFVDYRGLEYRALLEATCKLLDNKWSNSSNG